MSNVVRVSLYIREDQLERLEALKEEHGTPVAESIRRAIDAYIADKGIKATQKAGRTTKKLQERKRTATVLIARRRP